MRNGSQNSVKNVVEMPAEDFNLIEEAGFWCYIISSWLD